MNGQEWIEKHTVENSDNPYEKYVTEDGNTYSTLTELIQSGVFNFCGCGIAESNLEYIKNALKHINFRSEVYDRKLDSKESWKIIQEDELKTFGSKGSAYFFYYWSDTQDLTEHGGSVPGWLSQKGKMILEVLESDILVKEQEE